MNTFATPGGATRAGAWPRRLRHTHRACRATVPHAHAQRYPALPRDSARPRVGPPGTAFRTDRPRQALTLEAPHQRSTGHTNTHAPPRGRWSGRKSSRLSRRLPSTDHAPNMPRPLAAGHALTSPARASPSARWPLPAYPLPVCARSARRPIPWAHPRLPVPISPPPAALTRHPRARLQPKGVMGKEPVPVPVLPVSPWSNRDCRRRPSPPTAQYAPSFHGGCGGCSHADGPGGVAAA